MADCSNVEIRELLPERASGALSAADLARVDAHLASCGMCTSELALIESARSVLRRAPELDVARIAVAVRAATAAPARPVLVGGSRVAHRSARSRWIGWKAAAAVALAAAGGGTMLVWQRADDRSAPTSVVATAATTPASTSIEPVTGVSTTVATVQPAGSTGAAAEPRPALNVAGGLSDLTDSDLQALLDDMGSIGFDSQSFEEPEPVLPQLPGSEGTES